MYMRDEIFMRRENRYCLMKDGKTFNINAHKGKLKISMISANQTKKFINSSRKIVFIFLRENQPGEELIRVKAYLDAHVPKRRNNRWRSCFSHTNECSKSLNGYHLRGKWSTRYSCFLTPCYQILGCIDSLF
jgi:hypothetical protein